jgi:hypothetical protein
LHLLEQAIARNPYYGSALARGAACCHRLLLTNRSEDRAADRLRAVDFARRVLDNRAGDRVRRRAGAAGASIPMIASSLRSSPTN